MILACYIWKVLVPWYLIGYYGEAYTMTHFLKFLSRRIKSRPLRFVIGMIYGNLVLYGYVESARIGYSVAKLK